MGRAVRKRNRPQRLDRLEATIVARPHGTDSALDLELLTPAERGELGGLTSKLRRHPNGRWDFAALADADLERLKVLVVKGQGVDVVDGGPAR